jgi:hypothetical protein
MGRPGRSRLPVEQPGQRSAVGGRNWFRNQETGEEYGYRFHRALWRL